FTFRWLIVFIMVISLIIGIILGLIGPYAWAFAIGSLVIFCLIISRQDELAAVIVLAIHLNLDWYLGFRIISLVLTLVLLCSYYVGRSDLHPWTRPRYLLLWFIFLILTIIPAIHGAIVL